MTRHFPFHESLWEPNQCITHEPSNCSGSPCLVRDSLFYQQRECPWSVSRPPGPSMFFFPPTPSRKPTVIYRHNLARCPPYWWWTIYCIWTSPSDHVLARSCRATWSTSLKTGLLPSIAISSSHHLISLIAEASVLPKRVFRRLAMARLSFLSWLHPIGAACGLVRNSFFLLLLPWVSARLQSVRKAVGLAACSCGSSHLICVVSNSMRRRWMQLSVLCEGHFEQAYFVAVICVDSLVSFAFVNDASVKWCFTKIVANFGFASFWWVAISLWPVGVLVPGLAPAKDSGDFWAQPAKVRSFTTSTCFFRIWSVANLLPFIWTGQYPIFVFQVLANFFFIVMTTVQELGHW